MQSLVVETDLEGYGRRLDTDGGELEMFTERDGLRDIHGRS